MRQLPTVVAVLVLLLVPASSPGAELEFVAPDEVKLKGSDGSASVWLRNTAAEPVTPAFTLIGVDKDGDGFRAEGEVQEGKDRIEPGRVERYKLVIPNDASEEASGQLVARAEDAPQVAAASVDIEVSPTPLAADTGVGEALWFPAALALALILGWSAWVIVTARGDTTARGLGSDLPVEWSSSTFASGVTGVGALLATVVSAEVLPEDTIALPKTAYTALALIFGIAIAVAGVVYEATQGVDADGKPIGRVWGFLVAAFILLWATFGQLFVLFLLIDELAADKGFSGWPKGALQALLVIAALAMFAYTRRIGWTVAEPPEKKDDGAKTAASTVAAIEVARARAAEVRAARSGEDVEALADEDEALVDHAAVTAAAVAATPASGARRRSYF